MAGGGRGRWWAVGTDGGSQRLGGGRIRLRRHRDGRRGRQGMEGGGSLALPHAARAAGFSRRPAGLSLVLPCVDPAAGGTVATADNDKEEVAGSGILGPMTAGSTPPPPPLTMRRRSNAHARRPDPRCPSDEEDEEEAAESGAAGLAHTRAGRIHAGPTNDNDEEAAARSCAASPSCTRAGWIHAALADDDEEEAAAGQNGIASPLRMRVGRTRAATAGF
uniref:Uncharacterized protein n=1 Tax=Oryza nivara TaxID=4536 RepID=A0A0E0GQN0_ORYNI